MGGEVFGVWGVDAVAAGGADWVAATGGGGICLGDVFGFVDSFVGCRLYGFVGAHGAGEEAFDWLNGGDGEFRPCDRAGTGGGGVSPVESVRRGFGVLGLAAFVLSLVLLILMPRKLKLPREKIEGWETAEKKK